MDFSAFKNIDFANPENLLFLGIIFVLFIIAFSIIFFILAKIGKAIKRLFVSLFNIESQKPEFKQAGGDYQSGNSGREIKMPAQKNAGGGFLGNFNALGKKPEEKIKDDKKYYAEKEQKGILDSLNKLKGGDVEDGKETMGSKMPSRLENQEDDNHQEIKIPRPKRFAAEEAPQINSMDEQIKKNAVVNTGSSEKSQSPAQSETQNYTEKKEDVQTGDKASEQKIKLFDGYPTNNGSSIFGGKLGISRRNLKYEMRKNAGVAKAARAVRLNLSPVERSKLVKEVFSNAYKNNISKTDLKRSIRTLSRKMGSAKDNPAEHAKLRKEIKFFKKIGGI